MTAWPVNVRVTLRGSGWCVHVNLCVCVRACLALRLEVLPLGGGADTCLQPQKEVTLKGYGNDRDSAALQQRTAPLAKQIMLQGAIQTLVIMFFLFFGGAIPEFV